MKFSTGPRAIAGSATGDRETVVDDQTDAIDGSNIDRPIGDILKSSKHLSDGQIEEILSFQKSRKVPFGEAAVALRHATQDDVLWALSQQFQYPYTASVAPEGVYRELVSASDPFSPQAEAFRELRSQLLMGVWAPKEPRCALAVISPDRGDGKTFIAANLAVVFSQMGGHTLLIDLDMRTPRQHEIFGLEQGGGISNILSGRSETNVIRPIKDLPSLFVLPVGVVPPNPLELVQRSAFPMLIHELFSRFDHVIVDTPANSHGADARVIAAQCGAAIAVGRQGTSRITAMQQLLQALSKGPAKMAGVVMNDH